MKLFRLSLNNQRGERRKLLDEELARLKPEGTVLDKLLVVRPLGDEASMGLVVSQFFSWVQNRILNGLQSVQDWLCFWRKRKEKPGSPTVPRSRPAGCFLGLLKVVVFFMLFVWLGKQETAENYLIQGVFNWLLRDINFESLRGFFIAVLSLIPLAVFMALLAVYVLSSIASLILLLGLLLVALPFGADAMFWNLFASTTAKTSPVGDKPAQIFVAVGVTTSGLEHSGIYVHEKAIEQIVQWISQRSNNPAPAAS